MTETPKKTEHSHFGNKEALEHVAEKQASGIITSRELHGSEITGTLFAAADSAREMGIILLMIWIVLSQTTLSFTSALATLAIFGFGWILWKTGRTAWMAWFRLERMHRVVDQERWEIKHHREQEREELYELYSAKGFKDKLLDDVVDVLMADEDRLLRVMVEEELCLAIGRQDHPLKQATGSAIGATISTTLCLALLVTFPDFGLWLGAFSSIIGATAFATYHEGNKMIPSITWSLGVTAFPIGAIYFLYQYVS